MSKKIGPKPNLTDQLCPFNSHHLSLLFPLNRNLEFFGRRKSDPRSKILQLQNMNKLLLLKKNENKKEGGSSTPPTSRNQEMYLDKVNVKASKTQSSPMKKANPDLGLVMHKLQFMTPPPKKRSAVGAFEDDTEDEKCCQSAYCKTKEIKVSLSLRINIFFPLF